MTTIFTTEENYNLLNHIKQSGPTLRSVEMVLN